MRTISINMMGNKLIWQSLANKKQKERPSNSYMQISYACVVLLFHSQHVRKVHNGIRKGLASLQEKKRSKRTHTNFPIISLCQGSFQRLKGSNICSPNADLANFELIRDFHC